MPIRALWEEVRHPEHQQFSVAEMLEHERAHLMPMPVAFDGYVEKPACVFRTIVTDRFGSVTAEFGNVTGHFGDVTD